MYSLNMAWLIEPSSSAILCVQDVGLTAKEASLQSGPSSTKARLLCWEMAPAALLCRCYAVNTLGSAKKADQGVGAARYHT